MSEFNIETATHGQVVDKLKSVEAELKGILAKGENATPEEYDRADAALELCNALKEKSANFASRFKRFNETAADLGNHLHKPANGMVHASGGEAKGANDKGVEFKKDVEQVMLGELPKGDVVFKSAGGFFHAVRTPYERDSREKIAGWENLLIKSPSGMYEGGEPDGGVLIPPEYSMSIYERAVSDENYLADCDMLTIKGNAISLPALDDSSRVDGSRFGGVQSYWAGEADTFTSSRPKFRTMDFKLHKLTVLVYLTSELVDDSPFALGSYISNLAAREIGFKTNNALVNGTGAGKPKGLIASGSKIAVAKETGQASATVVLENIENMWMRLNPMCRKNAVWLHNNDTMAALNEMSFPVGTGGVPIFQPQGGLSNPGYATLKGRPLVASEFCQTLGTEGDLILVDWSFYQAVSKGGVNSAMSMHVKFLTDELAYRFSFRLDGQTKWDKPLTPFFGTTTTSSVVTLATR